MELPLVVYPVGKARYHKNKDEMHSVQKRRFRMKRYLKYYVQTIMMLGALTTYAKDPRAKPPVVIHTFPANVQTEVTPGKSQITVTFDEEMTNRSWSWSYEDNTSFPEIIDQPYFQEDRKTCVLPVMLEAGKTYVIWINTEKHKNFKNASGVAAEPYRLTFRTSKR